MGPHLNLIDPPPFEDITDSPPPQGVIFIVKALATGETRKHCVHCEPNATLSVLRGALQNDEDKIMSADDRFHQGGFRVGKSAEGHIKWRDILQGNVIGILSKDFNPPSALALAIGDRPSSSPFLPPATVPLHRLTRGNDRLYGNIERQVGSYSHSYLWKYDGLLCRIWEKQESGMAPLHRLYSSKYNTYFFMASEEDTNWWVKGEDAKVEFVLGYVYRSDGPCPEGAVPLYGVNDGKIGHLLTLSDSERDSCSRLGAKDFGIICYVAPP